MISLWFALLGMFIAYGIGTWRGRSNALKESLEVLARTENRCEAQFTIQSKLSE